MNKQQTIRFGVLALLTILAILGTLSVPSTKDLMVDVQPIGLQIVSQSPADGQRLELSAPIEITFDRDMDQVKTTEAFSLLNADLKPVSGKITWGNSRTLTFTPNIPLQASTTYKAVISTQATALDGATLNEEQTLEFPTIELLSVAQFFPANATSDVDLNANITVIFNHPVVPVILKEEQDKLPQPLKFIPPIKGKGEWVNSSVYVYQPEENLKSGTRYQVRIEAGLKDVNGNQLESSYKAQFSTRKPSVYNVVLKNGETLYNRNNGTNNIPLDQKFIVSFQDQSMNTKSVEAAIQIIDNEKQTTFPLLFEWNDSKTEVTVSPDGKFKMAGYYRLIIKNTAQANDGGYIREAFTVNFSTIPYPSLVATSPKANTTLPDYTSNITLSFASKMNVDSIKSHLQITPAIKDAETYFNSYGNTNTFSIYGLEPDVDYVVRLEPGMEDIYGNTIKDGFSFTFKNGNYPAYTRLALPYLPLIYRAKGVQDIYFEHLNVDQASLYIYPLSFEEFQTITNSSTGTNSYQPKSKPIREWDLPNNNKKNELETSFFSLKDENGNPLKPGFYFVGSKVNQFTYDTAFYDAHIIIVATDNVTMKSSATEGLAWIVDLESGKPQQGVPVTFYDEHFVELGKSITDKDGVAFLKDLKKTPYFTRSEGNGHFAFTAIGWGSGASAGNFGIMGGYYTTPESLFGYIYTDRALYRPGQDVYFKGILRENDDLHYSISNLDHIYVVVQSSGENIYEKSIPVSGLGSFSDMLKLSSGSEVGTYYIYVYKNKPTPTDAPITNISFRVAEYEKPEFEVTVTPDHVDVLKGDTVKFAIDSTYYSGGHVANGNASWFIESNNFVFTPSNDYSEYNFTDWDIDSYFYPTSGYSRETIAEGENATDANGHTDISQEMDFGEKIPSQTVTFNTNVTDVTGNIVSGGTNVIVHQSEFYAGIHPQSYVGTQNKPQNFDVVVLDWGSQPIAKQVVNVKFVERQWFSVQEQDKQGNLQWKSSVKENLIDQQTATTGIDGKVTLSFIPPKGGVYKATVTVKDSKGNLQQSSAYMWVSGNDYVAWRQTNDRSFSLIADKDLYSPGDVAEILIAQPFEGKVYALVTYERGHIYKEEVVLLEGNSTIYKLPITNEMAPIAYVSVSVLSGAENTNVPNYKIGMTTLHIDTEEKIIDVTVTPSKKTAGPGDEITYSITTKDINGKPVSADVSLAVIDKAILALAPSNSASLLSSFYPERELGVMTALGLVSSADAYNENYRKTVADGQAMGGGGGDNLGVITVRQNFKDTAIFKAQITTDQNGEAQVTFKLPENLTTWHADVRAVTKDSRVGEASVEIASNKPLYVQLQTPRFFVSEDKVQIGAALHNNTESSMMVNVTLDATGVVINSDILQSVKVEPGQQQYVTWDILVNKDSKRVDLTATAVSGQYTDASKPTAGTLDNQGIPVFNFTTTETVGTSGMLSSTGTTTEAIQLPTSYNFTDANLNIEISPSLIASMQSGFTYLQDYPYLCTEQTISRFLPNLITAHTLRKAGLNYSLQKDLDMQVNSALQRIYAKQLYDGGWSWWDGPESDPQSSAYVVYGLLEAKAAGYPISESALQNGIEYLKQNVPYLNQNASQWMFNRNAFILFVLAKGEAIKSGSAQLNYLYKYNDNLSLYAKAYLAQTFHLLDSKDERINTLMSDLQTAAIQSSSGAHWEEGTADFRGWNTNTRTTAIVLNAYIQIQPQNPTTISAVRWLMAHRQNGYWYSTQETTWSLIALNNWLIVSKDFETDYKFAVGLNGKSIEQGHTDKQHLEDVVNLQVKLEDMLKNQANYLVFTRGSGTGNLYYTANLQMILPVKEVKALDQGITVSRQYFLIDDPKTPITSANQGDIVQVRLTLVAPSDLYYVSADDPLPAGLEAIDSTLTADTLVPSNYTITDFNKRGWGWWYFDHTELYDDKIVVSADYLPAGTYVYTYLARASNIGTFNVIPPTASEFYFPDVSGRGEGSTFIVK
ncbi:MAG: Ig-like domain-containing protein [Anaerolineales bacterium]